MALFRKDRQILVAFGATNSSETEVSPSEKTSYRNYVLWEAVKNIFWKKPLLFQRAYDLVGALREVLDGEMVLTGQSLGGGLASYVGLKLDLKTICFNALPLGSWVHQEVPQLDSERRITQVTLDTDFLSDNRFLWLPGRRLFVPTAYPGNTIETHGYIVGSLLDFLGFSRCAKPAEVVERV